MSELHLELCELAETGINLADTTAVVEAARQKGFAMITRCWQAGPGYLPAFIDEWFGSGWRHERRGHCQGWCSGGFEARRVRTSSRHHHARYFHL